MEKSFQIDATAVNILQVILDTLDALVVILDDRGRIIYFNRASERLTGFKSDEVLGKPAWMFLLPEEAAAVRDVFQDLSQAPSRSRHENYWVGKNGSRHRIAWSNVSVNAADGSCRVIGTGTNVTARRKAESSLRQSRGELRRLTAQLIRGQEEHSRHLSRELHDDISQRLAALGFEIGRLKSGGMEDQEAFIDRLNTTIAKLAHDVHSLSRQLHPSILEDLGLIAALRNECRAFTEHYGIPLECHAVGLPDAFPADVALHLYRIVQEALRNVGKHAQASSVRVALDASENQLRLSVEDSGVGFDAGQRRDRPGLGLVGMRERARLIGAKLSVTSSPGAGTRVQVRVQMGRRRRHSVHRSSMSSQP